MVLLHGYISAAQDTWLDSGAAAGLLAAGRRLIMPDMRGHGVSAKPHEPSAYPPDALVSDVRALIAHLGLVEYDLGGYSLGALLGPPFAEAITEFLTGGRACLDPMEVDIRPG